jgi:high-affinity Fe2+/Pb2+ permease
MFRCNLVGKQVQKIELRGELQSILLFNHLKQAGQREYDKPDSGVNGQTKLMQQDSHMLYNNTSYNILGCFLLLCFFYKLRMMIAQIGLANSRLRMKLADTKTES